jgi:uncharacterized protein
VLWGTYHMPSSNLTLKDKQTILKTARHAIQYGLLYHKAPHLELEKYSPQLQTFRATFVTLNESDQLRGCIGSLKAYQPLIQDVAEHAYAAAFKDPRFSPVNHIEEPLIHISISILSEPVEIKFDSEEDLLAKVVPNQDGLILRYNSNNGTFLPSVWKQIQEPKAFINQLKLKAGLSQEFWHSDIKVLRYSCDTID